MLAMGEQGYLDTCQKILRAADLIQAGIRNIKGLRILGEPLFVIAFAANDFDIFQVMDRMSTRGWSLNGLHRPACLHICVTLRHAQDHVAQQFVDDLTASVDEVRSGRATKGGMAPVYGLAANLPVRGLVGELLKRYVDEIYRP
jgi:glutamate/tyrosine decarboxylase-like PLP-dependent enzyme